MVVAEIAAGVTSIKAALDVAQAMVGIRDAVAFEDKKVELLNKLTDAIRQSIEAREAHAAQLDRNHDLEKEIARLIAWDAEKQRYELKTIGAGAVAYMLKPEARGTEPPHWLCANCFSASKKSFLQATGETKGRANIFRCSCCNSSLATSSDMKWL